MALWGKSDTLAASPKYVTRKAVFDAQSKVSSANDTIDLSSANTNFSTGDGVVYTGASGIGLTQDTSYYVMRQTDNTIKLATTEAGAKAGATGINLTAGATGAIGFLQRNAEGNESTAAGNGDHINNGSDLYFIDADEAQQAENKARGLTGPGWWLYRSWTNADGSVQHRAECLIAMGAYSGATGVGTYQAQTGDASDDSVLVDATVSITTQPSNASVTAPATASFSIVAAIAGAGSLTYQWQIQQSGVGAFADVTTGSGGTTATYTTAATAVAAGAGATNGDKFRCIVGASTGNTDVTSNAVTLTVTA